MKKITLMVALLGSFYFSNAQVGIGTPEPKNSSMLDVQATNKGILIPRVELTSTTVFAPIIGEKEESLLVYNLTEVNDVTPGYYYWRENKWNRIINKDDLDSVISENKVGDVFYQLNTDSNLMELQYWTGTAWVAIDFKELVKANETLTFFKKVKEPNTENAQYLYFSEEKIQEWINANPAQNTPSNIDDAYAAITIDVVGDVVENFESILNQKTEYNSTTISIEEIIKEIASQTEGNVIYKNIAAPTDPENWVFQYWDSQTQDYITIELKDLVAAMESKTLIVKSTDGSKQYYISEAYLVANKGSIPLGTDVDGWADNSIVVPNGVYEIDVIGGIVNNFTEFITTNITDGNTNYNTVEEYIEYISTNAMQAGMTKIIIDTTVTPNQATFEIWDADNETWIPVPEVAFSDIVKANETETVIGKSVDDSTYTSVTVDPKAADKIVYEYLTENELVKNYMDVTSDVEWSIINNEDVQNAISDVLNVGGNVYFTRTEIAATDNDGTLIPAYSFYTIDASTGLKVLVDIAETIVNAITNATNEQKQLIKNALGDQIVIGSSIITGDTYNGKAVRKGEFVTTVHANKATTSGVTLDVSAEEIISITVKYGSGLVANITDLVVSGTSVDFRIGTGNMYQVLGTSDIDADVIIEFVEL